MLKRKMLRDIKQNLSQFITIFLMVFIGVMVYSGIKSYMEGMKQTANNFYTNYNLQDLNVIGDITKENLDTIKQIENVKNAESKLVVTGVLEENSDITLQLSFIESNEISKFYIVEGTEFKVNTKGIWLDNFFAEENNLKIGDVLKVKYDGYALEEKIVGFINVPDHLYDVKDESQIYPDHKTFGFAYMSVNELEEYIKIQIMQEMNITDNKKFEINFKDYLKYNYIMVDIDDKGKINEVKNKIEEKINNIVLVNIEDTSSYKTYQGEIEEGETYIGVVSGLFIFIAVLCVITTMTRVVKKQRIQIGTLKALGFKSKKIILHYIIYSFWISLFASAFGIICGRYFIGNLFIKMEMSFSIKWNIRDMFRNKARTITGIIGVSACTMLIVCSLGMLNSINHFIDLQFNKLFNFDYKLTIKSDANKSLIEKLTNKYGNVTSQNLYIEIKDNDGNRTSNNIFVIDCKNYIRFIDDKEKFIGINENDGVYITYKLAKTKGYNIGDEITWHISGNNTYYTSKIVGFNKDPQNQNVTMMRKYLENLGIEYKPDSLYTNEDLSFTKEIKGIEVVADKEELKEDMNGMLEMTKTMITLIIFVAVVLGIVIIYNLGILSYSEKQYQFATLKVLGFKDKEIRKIFIKQNNIISCMAIIIGLPLGFYLTDWMFKTAIEESYDFGDNINIETYIIAAIGTFIMSYFVSKILARKINKIDMVTSLKGNE